jgi:uncharacterized integral membrane protein
MVWIKRLFITALILIFSTFVVLFTLRNNALVDIDLVFIYLAAVKIELALVLSFILGGLMGLFAIIPLYFRIKKRFSTRAKAAA